MEQVKVEATSNNPATYTTRDLAEQFKMNQRKVRAWLDYFYDYIQPSTNEKGHWVLDEAAYERFEEVVKAMANTKEPMNTVRKRLLAQISEPEENEDKVVPIRQEVSYGLLKQTMDLVAALEERMAHIETNQKSLLDSYNQVMQRQAEDQKHRATLEQELSSIHSEVTDLREKVTKNIKDLQFSLQMVELGSRGSRKKSKGFRLFG